MKKKRRQLYFKERFTICKRQKWQCFWCLTPITLEDDSTEIDHVEPFSVSQNCNGYNLVAACKRCNRTKLNYSGLLNYQSIRNYIYAIRFPDLLVVPTIFPADQTLAEVLQPQLSHEALVENSRKAKEYLSTIYGRF